MKQKLNVHWDSHSQYLHPKHSMWSKQKWTSNFLLYTLISKVSLLVIYTPSPKSIKIIQAEAQFKMQSHPET